MLKIRVILYNWATIERVVGFLELIDLKEYVWLTPRTKRLAFPKYSTSIRPSLKQCV